MNDLLKGIMPLINNLLVHGHIHIVSSIDILPLHDFLVHQSELSPCKQMS